MQATSRVASFKALSSLTPAEIRYTPNKLDLVRRVLSTSDDAYRHAGIILDLTEKLGYTDDSARAEVLAMLVDAAVAAEDWELAREHVDAMVEMAEPDLGDGEHDELPGDGKGVERSGQAETRKDEEDGWGWDEGSTRGPSAVVAAKHQPDTAPANSKAKVRDVAYRSCLALGSSAYPDLGARLALLAQAVALAPPSEVPVILPLYHGVEALVASNPAVLRRTTSRPSSTSSPVPAEGETVLGSRRAAKAARLAYDLGASLNFPALRGMTVSPALGSARSDVSGRSAQGQAQGRRSASLTRTGTRGSIERTRGSLEQERDAAALFDHHAEPTVRAGARRALVKGVGWLLGADEGEDIL